ncbi:hypothetical protein ABK040_003217 [Willaertia magna]
MSSKASPKHHYRTSSSHRSSPRHTSSAALGNYSTSSSGSSISSNEDSGTEEDSCITFTASIADSDDILNTTNGSIHQQPTTRTYKTDNSNNLHYSKNISSSASTALDSKLTNSTRRSFNTAATSQLSPSSLSNITGDYTTNNSKAILSALQSLQEKIKQLQTRVDELEKEKSGMKEKYEQELFSQKMRLESERDSMREQLNMTTSENRRLFEKNQVLERDLENCKESKKEISVNHQKSQQRVLELEKKSNGIEKELIDLRENHSRLNSIYEQSQNRIDELQSNLTKTHKRKDKLEEEKKELQKQFHELIELHQNYVAKQQSIPPPKKKTRPKSAGGAVTKKKKEKTSIQSKLNSNKNIHERLKKATSNIPFLPPNPTTDGKTFNVNGTAQQALSSSNNLQTRKDQLQYYGANEHNTNKDHVKLLKEIDSFNNNGEVKECIDQMKEELKFMQEQYENYLKQLSDTSVNNKDFIKNQLNYLNDMMHKKQFQISILNNYQQTVCDKIREATSPPKIRGSEKRIQTLRLLNDLRKLQ